MEASESKLNTLWINQSMCPPQGWVYVVGKSYSFLGLVPPKSYKSWPKTNQSSRIIEKSYGAFTRMSHRENYFAELGIHFVEDLISLNSENLEKKN